MSIQSKNIEQSFKTMSSYIFFFTIIISILTLISNLIFVPQDLSIYIANTITLLLHIFLFIGYFYFKTKLKSIYGILCYTILFNVLLVSWFNVDYEYFEALFMRKSISVIILLPFIGFIINKLHSVIFGTSYLIFYIIIALISENRYLINSLAVLSVIIMGYLLGIYVIIYFLTKNLKKHEELNYKINLQNKELSLQANNLNEINKLLSQQTSEIRTQQKELKRLNSTKDKFLSLLAHDLKTPMNSILGFAELIISQFEHLSQDQLRRYVTLLHKSSKITYYLLENLLEWSRSQSHNIAYNPDNNSLNEIVKDVFELMKSIAEEKKIRLINKLNNTYVFADKYMITTILRNLTSNAIKYSNQNTEVVISETRNKETVTISVEDKGIGMTEEQIDSLFKIENSLSTIGTSGERGTGLGLLICHDFIKAHKSEFKVISRPGKGTTFSFNLRLTSK